MSARILVGDCLPVLPTLEAGSVQACVTSPPYWGLRDYGVSGQMGLERTPEEYVEKMVAVFREVRRVLANDATLWLNLGDSYAAGAGGRGDAGRTFAGGQSRTSETNVGIGRIKRDMGEGLKPKDLVGIPWMVAFALRADGWYLRSDIIWSKPNPMPESVTDRPTKAHEYLFLLAKSERYYYDGDAVREPYNEASIGWYGYSLQATAPTCRQPGGDLSRKIREQRIQDPNPLGRNRRSVWTVTTQPFADAHFATFPPKLIEPCILAGSRPGDTVLDPFGGAGTTGLVADRLGRHSILIELNPAYAAMARERIDSDCPLFNDVADGVA